MSTATNPARSTRRATIDDLLNVEGKVELIDGRVVHFMATGHQPNRVAFRIPRSLDDYARPRSVRAWRPMPNLPCQAGVYL